MHHTAWKSHAKTHLPFLLCEGSNNHGLTIEHDHIQAANESDSVKSPPPSRRQVEGPAVCLFITLLKVPTKGGWVKNNKTKNMHIWTIPVQKYIAETGKKHKYKENATCRTSTPPLLNVVSKTSWALWVNVQVCFVEICFFFYFPKENDKHTVTLIRGQPSLTSLQASWRKKKIECSTTEKNISRTPQERKNNVTKLFLFIIFREFYKIPAKLQPFFPCSLLNHRQPSITQATTVRFQ